MDSPLEHTLSPHPHPHPHPLHSPRSPPLPELPSSPAPPEQPPDHLDYTPSPVSHTAKPRRSILKQPPPPRQGFSFRRDILDPINSRISDTAQHPTSSATTFFRQAIGRLTYPHSSPSPSDLHIHPRSSAQPSSSSPSAYANLTANSSSSVFHNAPPSSSPRSKQQKLSIAPLKSVRFTMSSLAVVYPFGSAAPPGKEAETRDRVNSEHRAKNLLRSNSNNWSGPQLLQLYQECCRTGEEIPLPEVRQSLASEIPPTVLDLAGIPLSLGTCRALSDLLSVDWGLKKLILEDCGLTDESIKPILHGLLVSGSVPTLNIAKNRRIRSHGWQLVAIFIKKANFLRFLDVAGNNIDRKSLDAIIQAISADASMDVNLDTPQLNNNPRSSLDSTSSSTSSSQYSDNNKRPLTQSAELLKNDPSNDGLVAVRSLKLDSCGFKTQHLEMLAHGVRSSCIENISLRENRINSLGAVALAILIRDYDIPADREPSPEDSSLDNFGFPFQAGNSVTANQPPLPLQSTQETISSHTLPSLPQTQAPFSERINNSQTSVSKDQDQSRKDSLDTVISASSRTQLLRKIDNLPRIGHLVTLDVKSNDIKNGVLYIAQVLKRNRTLKVLNLSDNGIDSAGLISLSEALKYNNTLETLYLSNNPCCGPYVEGVNNLRSALMYNRSIMRLFLNSTGLTSEGAISLAEFLPDVKSLFHLDITENYEIDIAGVMALSVAVKMNKTIRCLDLNIPPDEPDFARLSQEILQSCIRNTEAAQAGQTARGISHPISAPIHKSAIVRDLKNQEERRRQQQLQQQHQLSSSTSSSSSAQMPSVVVKNRAYKSGMINAATECRDVLLDLVLAQENNIRNGEGAGKVTRDDQLDGLLSDVMSQTLAAKAQLLESISDEKSIVLDSDDKHLVATLCGELEEICERAKRLLSHDYTQISTATQSSPTDTQEVERSPVFSITDSDEESDTEVGPDNRLQQQQKQASAETSHSSSPSLSSPKSPLTGDNDLKSNECNANNHDHEQKKDTQASSPSTPEQKLASASTNDAHVKKPTLHPVNTNTHQSPSSLSPRSPLESQSRSFTLEEGEVFRKGSALGTADMDDEESTGEELKREILQTEIQRSPRSSTSLSSSPGQSWSASLAEQLSTNSNNNSPSASASASSSPKSPSSPKKNTSNSTTSSPSPTSSHHRRSSSSSVSISSIIPSISPTKQTSSTIPSPSSS